MEENHMRLKLLGCIMVVLFSAAAVAYAKDVVEDWDHSANFSVYKTYSWLKVNTPDAIWDKRTTETVDTVLAAKGWRKVQEGGDVGISAMGTTAQKQTLYTYYSGFGPRWGWRWRGWGGFGTATTTASTYTEGTLIIDMFDAKTKDLIWRGTAIDTLSSKPEKNEKKLAKVVEKMFENFPPGSSST
jgi:Domain of unknown function (DUF4136)